MDLIHSKISTKTHIKIDLMEEKLNRVHLDVKSVKKQQKELAENFNKFQESVQAQMMFFREQFEISNSNQTLILRNLEYHQLKIPETTKEFFNGNSAYFDAVDEEEKQTNFDTINDDSDEDLSEIFQSERYSESDNTSMIFDEKNEIILKLTVIFSDNKCFEEGEYFEYEGTNLLFSNYPQRALKDDYTVCRIGRICYNPDEEDQVINDIPFDKEVLDLETQEYTQGDLNVSNQHVTILNSNGRYFLVDLGSSNSTFIQVIDNVILREGMVFDITKDNLFVVEKIILPKDYKVSQPDDSTLDPYFLFLEGKDMCKEFLSVNSTRIKKYSFISMKPQVPMLQLRFLERNKAKIDGDSSTKLITIEQSSVSLDDQLWIGRDKQCFINLQGVDTISRKHCYIYLNENNDWVLNSASHEVFMSIRREQEWTPALCEENRENCQINRDPSIPIKINNGMQFRISDTCFGVKLS